MKRDKTKEIILNNSFPSKERIQEAIDKDQKSFIEAINNYYKIDIIEKYSLGIVNEDKKISTMIQDNNIVKDINPLVKEMIHLGIIDKDKDILTMNQKYDLGGISKVDILIREIKDIDKTLKNKPKFRNGGAIFLMINLFEFLVFLTMKSFLIRRKSKIKKSIEKILSNETKNNKLRTLLEDKVRKDIKKTKIRKAT